MKEEQFPRRQSHYPRPSSPKSPLFELDYGNYGPSPRTKPRRSHAYPSSVTRSSSSSSSVANPNSNSNIATSAISFHDTNHGRQRRFERNIPERDVQAAIKHGKSYPHARDRNLIIYEHGGTKYVVTKDTRALVTAMVTQKSVNLQKRIISHEDIARNKRVRAEILDNTSNWKSHSVLVVDKSGSMGNADVNGSRTRLGAVWQSLAQDYVDQRIRTGMACDQDIVTIILMGEKARILVDRCPTDYVLYNNLVHFFHDSELADREYCSWKHGNGKGRKRQRRDDAFVFPGGHGCYEPALKLAESTLQQYDNGSSALSLMVLSDGRPSDSYVYRSSAETSQKTLSQHVSDMACKFGRRFNFFTIGMGSFEKYDVLQTLVQSAQDYGSLGVFQVPSMSCAAIGAAISSVAASLTETQSELVALGRMNGNRQRRVKPVLREKFKTLPLLTEVVNGDEFDIYMDSNVEHYQYSTDDNGNKSFNKTELQHSEARGVAFKQCAFGEGQERLAHQFFELASDGNTVVGQSLVAKENRFIEEIVEALEVEGKEEEESDGSMGGKDGNTNKNWKARNKFAKRFCKIQHLARKAAQEFNDKLNGIRRLDPDTARVSFLDCSVYYLSTKKNTFAVVVETRLDGEFKKWNNNNGWHNGKKCRRSDLHDIQEEEGGEALIVENGSANQPLDLTEDNEDNIFVSHDEVAQAFSHFSFVHSARKMLICDLQGIYDHRSNLFRFTDPVIHYHDARKHSQRGLYGRTDMGRKGIHDFFKSHQCNCLCDLVTKGFVTPSTSKKAST